MKKLLLFILLIVLIGGILFWRKATAAKEYNLLLISIDTLRPDRLGSYGYTRDTSPNLDLLAGKSTVFENAYSASSWTLPSHVSLFSGQFAGVHGVNLPGKMSIGPETKLLAEILKEHGYRNFAFTGGGYVGRRYGFDRGFEIYTVHKGKKRDNDYDLPSSIAKFKEKIGELKSHEKFFVFFHTFDVHCPYNSPQPYMEMYKSSDSEYIDPYKCGTNYYNEIDMTEGQVKYISDRYDGGIRWADTKLNELFEYLKEVDRLDNTIIVITSDHGEEFKEHGSIGHKRSLHRELIHIPLIIHIPGGEPRRIKREVSLIDIFPTVLDTLRIEHKEKINGLSLRGLVERGDESSYTRSFQFSELDGEVVLRSHIDESGHLIKAEEQARNRYYDLAKDPLEKVDRYDQSKEEVERRSNEISILQKSFGSSKENKDFEGETPEEIEHLKSLGYL